MLTSVDALPLALDPAGEPQWQQVERSVQDRREVCEFDKREIGGEASPPYNYGAAIVVASAWLALCVIAAIHQFIAVAHRF